MVHAFCVVAALVLAPFTATFIQLNDDNASWSAERWQASVADADRLGIREVIVQWSMLDGVRFDRAVDAIVAAARDRGLRVTIGVAFDAQFWSALDRSDADLGRHLDKVREASLELAREVNARLGTDAPFAGWYLPQEIDDVHWTSPARRQLLLDFVRQIAEGLVAVRRGDVTLSGFANGQSAPNVYAAVWRDLARQGVTRVLFQDGVGAGKLAPESAAEYVAALTREVAGEHVAVQPVVELFAGGNDSPFRAAPFERVRHQIDALRSVTAAPLVAFAVLDYMSDASPEAAALRDAYIAAYLSPQRQNR